MSFANLPEWFLSCSFVPRCPPFFQHARYSFSENLKPIAYRIGNVRLRQVHFTQCIFRVKRISPASNLNRRYDVINQLVQLLVKQCTAKDGKSSTAENHSTAVHSRVKGSLQVSPEFDFSRRKAFHGLIYDTSGLVRAYKRANPQHLP
jgi:hypothetical protein